jgi:hypothetical protein
LIRGDEEDEEEEEEEEASEFVVVAAIEIVGFLDIGDTVSVFVSSSSSFFPSSPPFWREACANSYAALRNASS